MMRFHTDENVSRAIAMGLRRRGYDVTTTSDAGLLGRDDDEQLTYALREGRVTISHDADMLRLSSSGIEHAGIIYCHKQKYKTGEFIARIQKFESRVARESMHNHVEFL